MHRSRLSTFVIDCQVEDLDAAITFWSQALGREAGPPDPEDPNYRSLQAGPGEPLLLLQQVSHPSRIHLDIEADDLEAEVARLRASGVRMRNEMMVFHDRKLIFLCGPEGVTVELAEWHRSGE